jgi:hypothetical protein
MKSHILAKVNNSQCLYEKKIVIREAQHNAAVKLTAEVEKQPLKNLCLKSLSCENLISAIFFCIAYKVARENQSFHNSESEIDIEELNQTHMGHILH